MLHVLTWECLALQNLLRLPTPLLTMGRVVLRPLCFGGVGNSLLVASGLSQPASPCQWARHLGPWEARRAPGEGARLRPKPALNDDLLQAISGWDLCLCVLIVYCGRAPLCLWGVSLFLKCILCDLIRQITKYKYPTFTFINVMASFKWSKIMPFHISHYFHLESKCDLEEWGKGYHSATTSSTPSFLDSNSFCFSHKNEED